MTDTQRNKILVADDEKFMRRLMGQILEQEFSEFEIEFFEDGSSLESRLNNGVENVRMAVIDHEMPGVHGSELIRRYASKPELRKTPFILLYGGDESIGEQAVKDGAFAYLLKPSGIKLMPETIRAALNDSRYQTED